ncbi:MAG: hypothetical protein ACE5Q6_19180 [Dehalococcoidia bacterium]
MNSQHKAKSGLLERRVSRRDAIKTGGLAALGLAFSKPAIETIYPRPTFAQMSPVSPSGPKTLSIISGSDGNGNPGPLCGSDPLVTFTSPSVATPTNAIIGRGFQFNVCDDANDNVGSPSSQTITTSNGNDTSATFVTTFQLPSGFSDPVLALDVVVDDLARIYLNNSLLAEICLHTATLHSVGTTNPGFFQVGTNTLRFEVINNAFTCEFSAKSRGGQFDAMSIEFEGQVSFT